MPTANFSARIAAAAGRFPDRVAIDTLRASGTDRATYTDLMASAGRFAAWFLGAGCRAGDRAAILADNDGRWIACYLGILQAGGIAVPLDTAYKAGQVRTVLDNSGARLLFTTPRYLDTARAAVTSDPPAGARLVLLAGHAPDLPGPAEVDAAGPAPPVAEVAPEAAAVILYTSGTTSDPKGVVLTHANLEAERAAALSIVHVTEDDVILGVLPLFHALAQMANLLLPLTVGARVVFLESVNSTTLLEALQTRGISIFACVPQFFYLIHQRVTTEVRKKGRLARAVFRVLVGGSAWLRDRIGWNPGRRLFARVHRTLGSRMRILVTGGSRFDPAIGRDLYGMGFTLLNAYGLTETSGGATVVRPGDRFTSSVGQAFPGVEIRIGPREGDEDHGEVLIRGPIVMREYFGRPDATGETLRDGWLHSGDLGRLDEDGRLYITGRKKEIIVLASGKNLYPEEIEAHYRQAPLVKELCVLGLSRPGEPASERLHAVIVPDQDHARERGQVNLSERVRFEVESLSVQLPAHKRVLTYDLSLDPLPRTTTGKIKRHEVERRVRAQATGRAGREPRPVTDEDRAWLSDRRHADAVQAIAARLDQAPVTPGANLELDLSLDSMERVELLTWLEQRSGTRVAPETRAAIFTVRQLVDAVLAAPATGTAGSASADADVAWGTVLAEPPAADLTANLSKAKAGRALACFALVRLARALAWLLLGFRVSGAHHLPRRGPYLVCPNHQAYLDAFFLAAALPFRTLRQLFFVGAAEYFESPLMARAARAVNIVPVDPDANLVSAMRAGAAGLRLGKVLILFPEGERSIDGDLKTFRKGAAILASHLDAPVVPVALNGFYDLWPRGRPFNWRALLPGRRAPLRLEFGAPITIARGDVTGGTAAIRDAVEQMFLRMRASDEGQ